MSDDTSDPLDAAQCAAREARTRLSDTFCQIKTRLQPSTLIGEARDRIKDEVTSLGERAFTTAGDRPALIGMTSSAVLLFFLRKPLGRILGRVFSRDSGPSASN